MGGVAARQFERRKMVKIKAVWLFLPVSAPRGAVPAQRGTSGRDRHTADTLGRVRVGTVGGGGAQVAIAHGLGGRKEGAVTHHRGLRFRFRFIPRYQQSGGIGMGGSRAAV